MVSAVWALIAASSGLLCYLAIPALAPSLPIEYQTKIARHCWSNSSRAIGRPALVRRRIGGYSLMEKKIDDEKGAGKVVLDDSLLGDSKELHFDDHDNRTGHWNRKPMVVLHERLDGVIDAELSDVGYHLRQHVSEGKMRTDDGAVNPYIEMTNGPRVVNPDEALAVVSNDAEPTDPGTMEDFKIHALSKYRDEVGAAEVASAMLSFAAGVGGVALLAYVQNRLLETGGGGGGGDEPTQPVRVDMIGTVDLEPTIQAAGHIADAAVIIL